MYTFFRTNSWTLNQYPKNPKTIQLAQSLNFHSIGFSIVTPFPGTHLYSDCEKDNLLVSKDWSKYTLKVPRMLIKNPNYTEEELKALFSKGYHDFYIRPSYIAKMLVSIRTLDEAKYYFSQGMRMIK